MGEHPDELLWTGVVDDAVVRMVYVAPDVAPMFISLQDVLDGAEQLAVRATSRSSSAATQRR